MTEVFSLFIAAVALLLGFACSSFVASAATAPLNSVRLTYHYERDGGADFIGLPLDLRVNQLFGDFAPVLTDSPIQAGTYFGLNVFAYAQADTRRAVWLLDGKNSSCKPPIVGDWQSPHGDDCFTYGGYASDDKAEVGMFGSFSTDVHVGKGSKISRKRHLQTIDHLFDGMQRSNCRIDIAPHIPRIDIAETDGKQVGRKSLGRNIPLGGSYAAINVGRVNFAFLGGSHGRPSAMTIANHAVRSNKDLLAVPNDDDSRGTSDGADAKNQKHDAKQFPQHISIQHLYDVVGWISDDDGANAAEWIGWSDVDVSYDGSKWFHLFGEVCLKKLTNFKETIRH